MMDLEFYSDPRVVAWTAVATAYCVTAIYMKAFSRLEYPVYVWGSFLFVGSSLLLAVNRDFMLTPDTYVFFIAEWLIIVAAAVMGGVTHYVARQYAIYREWIEGEGPDDDTIFHD